MNYRVLGIISAIILGIATAIFLNAAPQEQPTNTEICDLIDNDNDGQIDEGFARTCTVDSDCGKSGTFGDTYCKNDNVYQGYYQVTCVGELGTCQSACQSQQIEQLQQECQNGCRQGRCITGQTE